MKRSAAHITREYGPFPDVNEVAGVSYDGTNIWIAAGDAMKAVNPESGAIVRSLDVPAHAGTAYDGKHLFQLSGDRIQKVDAESGRVVASIPAPEGGASGMAWAEGSLWVGQHRRRKIHQVDPASGMILRTIESNRFVTGVTWADKELWHGTWEDENSDIRRIDPQSGEVLELIAMPQGIVVSGLESDGGDLFFCGGGPSGKVRTVRKPKR
ncbi:MAG: glutamine cyclotransferase [Hyphomicrobiaceae bacterium]